ncbi:hypothetical protein XELAEV_18016533mg [Xenopus laevis]|uniref:Uncharacterized protein n=1 Tax=Xenopus laevis TaxID=8355 RepID=A0A974DK38_XENLA|nr:hypothetical protein XELAEV_18016533mg [Xenopus laevis]
MAGAIGSVASLGSGTKCQYNRLHPQEGLVQYSRLHPQEGLMLQGGITTALNQLCTSKAKCRAIKSTELSTLLVCMGLY